MNLLRQQLLIDRIHSLWRQEEAYWFQRARTNRIQFGDKNSKFFHAIPCRQRQNNYIFQLKDDQGHFVEGNESLLAHAYSHFQNSYGSSENHNFGQIAGINEPSISVEMNQEFYRSVSDDEVHFSSFQLGAFKAPRVDAFPGCFY
ncbi:hypothetical protein SLE2022_399690 [Rubroshorea leprosula]